MISFGASIGNGYPFPYYGEISEMPLAKADKLPIMTMWINSVKPEVLKCQKVFQSRNGNISCSAVIARPIISTAFSVSTRCTHRRFSVSCMVWISSCFTILSTDWEICPLLNKLRLQISFDVLCFPDL